MEEIREFMRARGLHAFVLPHNDAHFSEYIAARDEKLAFVSKFTGSAGTALITLDRALLWTDGRYFLQAERQLPAGWELMRQGECKTLRQFLLDFCQNNGEEEDGAKRSKSEKIIVGMDAITTSRTFYDQLTRVDGIPVELIQEPSLLDEIWREGRPASRRGEVVLQRMHSLGRNMASKLAFVREKLRENKCAAIYLCSLDDICWMLNARAAGENGEVPYNAVFFAYLVVHQDVTKRMQVYTDSRLELDEEEAGLVQVFAYDYFLHHQRDEIETGGKIWIDPNSTNCAIALDSIPLHLAPSCVQQEKAKKTREEVDAMRLAQELDAVALCRFLASLNDLTGNETELSLASRLLAFRKLSDSFAGNSFETISSVGEHSAIIHYAPKPETDASALAGQVYLLDSGGHYSFGGTTDTTRVVWLGKDRASADAKRCYTAVLKANIGLASAHFPAKTPASRLDVLARGEMWKLGLDYGHGTGHGVGNFLCVHEYPPLIAAAAREDSVAGVGLEANMCVTNEPGYYRVGEYGFRIENLMLIVESSVNPSFLQFETITHVPLCQALIDKSMLTQGEVDWVNAYHAKCRELILKRLPPARTATREDRAVREWVERETRVI